jgi:hypothetical protein
MRARRASGRRAPLLAGALLALAASATGFAPPRARVERARGLPHDALATVAPGAVGACGSRRRERARPQLTTSDEGGGGGEDGAARAGEEDEDDMALDVAWRSIPPDTLIIEAEQDEWAAERLEYLSLRAQAAATGNGAGAAARVGEGARGAPAAGGAALPSGGTTPRASGSVPDASLAAAADGGGGGGGGVGVECEAAVPFALRSYLRSFSVSGRYFHAFESIGPSLERYAWRAPPPAAALAAGAGALGASASARAQTAAGAGALMSDAERIQLIRDLLR